MHYLDKFEIRRMSSLNKVNQLFEIVEKLARTHAQIKVELLIIIRMLS